MIGHIIACYAGAWWLTRQCSIKFHFGRRFELKYNDLFNRSLMRRSTLAG